MAIPFRRLSLRLSKPNRIRAAPGDTSGQAFERTRSETVTGGPGRVHPPESILNVWLAAG